MAVSGPRLAAMSPAGAFVRLNRNENAYGPSPQALAAMREAASNTAHRYPDVEAAMLRARIADHHKVAAQQVVLGCGSSDILRMAVDAFARPGKTVIAAVPTFELVTEYARRAGSEVAGVPLKKDGSHDLTAMLARTDGSAGIVYICNPNNPTGSVTRRSDIEAFLRGVPPDVVVLVDEAYHHYVSPSAEYQSFIDRPVAHDRVIVTRSFSKIHGLAGLRVGYTVTSPAIARALATHQLLEGINAVAARAAVAALGDADHVRASVAWNTDDRQEFLNQANARMLRSVDSVANFVMLNTGRPAGAVIEHFRTHHVLVAGPIPGFDTSIRVSMGRPEEMREFWRVWNLLPGGHTMSM